MFVEICLRALRSKIGNDSLSFEKVSESESESSSMLFCASSSQRFFLRLCLVMVGVCRLSRADVGLVGS